jgi:hypothetical protein
VAVELDVGAFEDVERRVEQAALWRGVSGRNVAGNSVSTVSSVSTPDSNQTEFKAKTDF